MEIQSTQIALFKKKEIRKTLHNKEWWFVVNDVVQVLTGTPDVSDYIKKFRLRDEELNKGWGQIVTPLWVDTAGGRQQMNCANTEGMFRIVQSIPSPKAEPLKRWLAKVGYERAQEIENPELATKRTRMLYKLKKLFIAKSCFNGGEQWSRTTYDIIVPITYQIMSQTAGKYSPCLPPSSV